MRFTTTGVANAIKAGIEANFAPTDQEAELERMGELFLDLAASLEMQVECYQLSGTQEAKLARYADFLGGIGFLLDEKVES